MQQCLHLVHIESADWSAIDEQLQLAYRLLKKSVSLPPRPE
jgi:hypothetical protein